MVDLDWTVKIGEMKTLLVDAKETLEHITEREELDSLREASSDDIVAEKIDSFLKQNI